MQPKPIARFDLAEPRLTDIKKIPFLLIFVALCFLWLAGCGPTVSTVPLANAEPEGPDVYFYGSSASGGKQIAADGSPREKPSETPRPEPSPQDSATLATEPPPEPAKPPGEDAANPSATPDPFADLAGTYRGTDTVTIRLQGQPERVEKDDLAKLVVEAPAPGQWVFKIVDSQSGNDLCSVTGKPAAERLQFDAGQSCLSDIMGVPTKALVKSGSAKLNAGVLSFELRIDVELQSPVGILGGDIEYLFEGERE